MTKKASDLDRAFILGLFLFGGPLALIVYACSGMLGFWGWAGDGTPGPGRATAQYLLIFVGIPLFCGLASVLLLRKTDS